VVGVAMKTLNSRKNKELQIFTDNADKLIGFAGFVDVYEEQIYIDTRTGEGYNKVIRKLDKLISYLAVKYRFNGFSFEDGRQHVTLHILEGIPKFDPRRGVKLSTFIQMMVSRRLINELRNDSKTARNATFLNIRTYSCVCKCGYNTITTLSSDEKISGNCDQCGHPLSESERVIPTNPVEISLDRGIFHYKTENNDSPELSEDNELSTLYSEKVALDDSVISSCDIQKWLANEEPMVVKLIELICFHDYSLKAAADHVGISRAWADIKLKKLKDKSIVKEIFGRA